MDSKSTKVVQVTLTEQEKAAGQIRATQRNLTLSRHVGALLTEDAKAHRVWSLINREGACDD